MTSAEHLKKIRHKGDNILFEDGFSIFNGHENIFLGSNIFLVDTLINAGDTIGRVVIDDYAFFGHGVKVLARGHDYNCFNLERQTSIVESPIHIKEGVWVGSGAILLGGITIGKHSVVGAGSIVTKDVPEYTVVAGNPAREINGIKGGKNRSPRLRNFFEWFRKYLWQR